MKTTTTCTTCRMVQENCTKKVPYTTCQTVVENCVKKVPYQVCRMVPQTICKKVPYTVCTMVKETCIKKVPYTVCTMQKYTVCKQVPCTECRQVPYTVNVQVPYTVTQCIAHPGLQDDQGVRADLCARVQVCPEGSGPGQQSPRLARLRLAAPRAPCCESGCCPTAVPASVGSTGSGGRLAAQDTCCPTTNEATTPARREGLLKRLFLAAGCAVIRVRPIVRQRLWQRLQLGCPVPPTPLRRCPRPRQRRTSRPCRFAATNRPTSSVGDLQ